MRPQKVWERDTHGEENMNTGSSKSACEGRKHGHDAWCGNTDSEWLFVAGPRPSPTQYCMHMTVRHYHVWRVH